jgi:uncharacterized repeat protein (TIGR01451 family)
MTAMTRHPGARPLTEKSGRGIIALMLAMLAPLACDDATDVVLLQIGGSGLLSGQAFLDTDGNGIFNIGDEPLAGVNVVLVTSATAEAVDLVATDSVGTFILFDVPVGSYRLTLDSVALGDSLDILEAASPITVSLGDTAVVNIGATFPVLTLEEALLAPAGVRVFTSGIALNPRVNFDPTGQVHFAGDSLFLRALNVERAAVNTGDSVRLLGRVVTDNGRSALDAVTPFPLVPQASLVTPVDALTGIAANANGGLIDAALVRIQNAEITDTSTTIQGNFRFWADDGSDSVEVVLRGFLALNTAAIRPDTTLRVAQLVGLLTPFTDGTGALRWQLLPRSGLDIALETKFADVSVSVALDTAQASLGDTIEVTVVAANGGPLTATLVQVQDTVPAQMTYVSSSQTTGTYDSGTGIWNIGSIEVGTADTLRVQLEVTDGTPAIIANIAESLGLVFEVDPNTGNDSAAALFTIS